MSKCDKCPEGQRQIIVCLSDAEIEAIEDIQTKQQHRLSHKPTLCAVRRDLMRFAIKCTNIQTGNLPEMIPESTPEPPLAKNAFDDNRELYDMMDASPRYLMWAALPNNECIHVNPLLSTFTGCVSEEFLGVGWTKTIHPADIERVCRLCREGFESRGPFPIVYRMRKADGIWGWIQDYAHPFYRLTGHLAGYVGIMRVIAFERDELTPLASVISRNEA